MTASERNHRRPGCTCERIAPHVWDAAGCGLHRYEVEMKEAQERNGLNAAEPAPIANSSRPIWGLVIEDMQERDRAGRQKYGTPLQAGNGRDALVDAYQEALDLVVYLRQEIEQRRQAQEIARAAMEDV